jgi:hypothetical protein
MTPFQKIIRDPAFWTLVLLNLFIIYGYNGDPKQYSTIIWLYWCQSVLLGIFNFFDMLTLKNADVSNLTINGKPATKQMSRGCLPFFFLGHYGIFHFVYLIFLSIDFQFSNVDYSILKWAILGLFVNQLIHFIQNKTSYSRVPRKIGTMFFVPYLRIVPMHLTILLPKFIGWTPVLTFLILKTIFDLLGHLITTPYYWRIEESQETGYI